MAVRVTFVSPHFWLRRAAVGAAVLCALSLFVSRPHAEQVPSQDGQQKAPPDVKTDEIKEDPLPLKPEGKIEFTTDEGSWLSLDVSPDGRTIVFELLGDIYTLPFEGGDAVNIAPGMSFDSQPAFSPDGATIAFLSDRSGNENLWLMDADGQNPRAVTKGARSKFVSPTWTPDGNYVIASRTSGRAVNSLWLYHKDGGSGIEMVKSRAATPDGGAAPAAKSSLGAVVSPDGRYVFFSQRTGLFSYNVTSAPYQIERFDRETGETSGVTGAQGGSMRPLLSPDGKSLVYATRFDTKTGYRIRELETGDERWLIYPVTRDDQESAATRDTMPRAAFTPDGKELVTNLDGKIVRVDVATGATTNIPFVAKVEQDIGPRVYFESRVEEGPVQARLIRWPQQSPDGTRLVFTALNKLYIMDLPNGEPRRLTDATVGEFAPVWAPDGLSVAYVTWAPDGGHIWKVAVDGGAPQQLSRRAAYYSDLAWTPDGERIVVVSGARRERIEGQSGEGLQLRWLAADGGDTTFIAPMTGRSPHFANASDRIYLWAGGAGLTSMRFDGTDRKTHVKITGPSTGGPTPPAAEDARISPDGQSAFAVVQNKLFVVTIPQVGGDAPTVSVTDSSSMPVKKLSIEGGEFLSWTPDGQTVTWSLGATFYRQQMTATEPESFTARLEFPRARPEGSVVLRGAKAITMKGDEVIAKSDILITNNRIAAIGVQGRVPFPAGTRIIDVAGKTIMPGIVDVHAHLRRPAGIHQTQVWSFLANLAFGVTTTRDPQTGTNDTFVYEDMVETGEILGPRVYSTGPGIFSSSGLDDLDATRAFIKRYKETYHTNTVKQYMVGDRKVRQWVIMAAKEYGLTPTVEGGLDLKLNLSHMIDGYSGHEHTLPLHPLYRDVIQFVVQSKTFYTPTMLVAYGAPWAENYFYETTDVHGNERLRRFTPHSVLDSVSLRRPQWFAASEYDIAAKAKVVADIVHQGGRAGLGSHGQLQGLGAHWELWAMQMGGLTTHEALRVATIFGAEAIGFQRDLGSLEPGKLADLLVLDADPLVDIHNTNTVRMVMKNGELYNADTLDQMWPTVKKLDLAWMGGGDPKAPSQNR
ncbi:MAG: PD40 domain-containing protein [Acidobacteria bacterium]|nr:PD40 domain-containing protein [Acidobacteriota bacterium]